MKKSLKYLIFSAFSAAILTSASLANADAIADRKAKMKEVGKNFGVIAKMVKGENPFDGKAALAAYMAIGEAGTGFGELFPEGSETGGKTTASPKIWSDREGFQAKGKAFGEDLTAAIGAGEPADLDALKVSFGSVAKNCKACHEGYRVKKE